MKTDWRKVPTFGVHMGEPSVIRPSAYGVVADDRGQLAIVRSPRGVFLPGGGIDAGETPEEAVKREMIAECGLIVQPGTWRVQAIQFVYSEPERTHFEKRCTFIESAGAGHNSSGLEPDHELIRVRPEVATQMLSHQSHCWAVECWRKHLKELNDAASI